MHGWGDDVVPCSGSQRYAAATRAALLLVDGDHRLTEQLPEIGALFSQFLGNACSRTDGRQAD